MTAQEREAYTRDGYLVRRSVFGPAEIEALRDAAETVAAAVRRRAEAEGAGPEIELPDGHRLQFQSRSVVQWEWAQGSREIRIVEPIDHLDTRFASLFDDRRLLDVARDALGCDAVGAFTSKLNLKRAREGSRFPWHQDFPYWFVRIGDEARDVVTALILLDAADAENGALRVLPGSHRGGPAPRDPDDPTRSLADPARIDEDSEVTVEGPAGSVVFFGSLLLHRSSPNRSSRDRRALLSSFQPVGRPHWRDTPYHPERVEQLP